jgi:hypothetical protein
VSRIRPKKIVPLEKGSFVTSVDFLINSAWLFAFFLFTTGTDILSHLSKFLNPAPFQPFTIPLPLRKNSVSDSISLTEKSPK